MKRLLKKIAELESILEQTKGRLKRNEIITMIVDLEDYISLVRSYK